MKPLIVGIAGGTGSGKTTVARKVAAALDASSVAFVDMDAYYIDYAHLPIHERRRINWDHPNAFDWELMLADMHRLSLGQGIDKPQYDFVEHVRRPQRVRVNAAEVVVIEGLLLLAEPRLRELCDVKVFVDTDADIRLIRRLRRDILERGRPIEEILDQYLTTVQPMHLEFVEPSKRYADVIVPRGGENEVAIAMIVAQIHHREGSTLPPVPQPAR